MARKRARLTVTSVEPYGKVRPFHIVDVDGGHYGVVLGGQCPHIKNLACSLITIETLKSNVQSAVYPGKILRVKKRWYAIFTGLPIKRTQRYLVVVTQTCANTAKAGNRALTMEIEVEDTKTKKKKPAIPSIPISCPIDDEVVCPTFLAYGTQVNPAVTGATMTRGSYYQNGVPIAIPDPNAWMFQFTDLPVNTGYTFSVTNGTITSTSINITVDDENCPVIDAPPPAPVEE